ncbi:MAG: hypothetical protein KA715_11425 [Xanthomonadaceae bacterium]|nr:hypothetical protein [Xanthomonadaceae bacterium]
MNKKELIQRAKQNALKREKLFFDIRTQRVLGKLVHKKLMLVPNVFPYRGLTFLEDALWVGENVEPRVLELLPAILLKLPHLFVTLQDLPQDLKKVIDEIKGGVAETQFRGVEPEKYLYWIAKIGRKDVHPAKLKTFRFMQDDIKTLAELVRMTGETEAQILRDALKALKQSLLVTDRI